MGNKKDNLKGCLVVNLLNATGSYAGEENLYQEED